MRKRKRKTGRGCVINGNVGVRVEVSVPSGQCEWELERAGGGGDEGGEDDDNDEGWDMELAVPRQSSRGVSSACPSREARGFQKDWEAIPPSPTKQNESENQH